VRTSYGTNTKVLIDPEWLYTLVQAGATFSAIVGAFFTTKILTIASEKRALQNRIAQLWEEISQRQNQIQQMQDKVDTVNRNCSSTYRSSRR
jgi:peptidoglycan hydrolase CwlO-like protein